MYLNEPSFLKLTQHQNSVNESSAEKRLLSIRKHLLYDGSQYVLEVNEAMRGIGYQFLCVNRLAKATSLRLLGEGELIDGATFFTFSYRLKVNVLSSTRHLAALIRSCPFYLRENCKLYPVIDANFVPTIA